MGPREIVASLYRRFAEQEAAGRSPLYEEFAQRVAADEALVKFVVALPPSKWQPNLLFGAVRYLCGTPGNAEEFARLVGDRGQQIAELMATRATQTNEPARCATLMPALAGLPQPLALLEVGAAAGLCLLPDRYAYDFDGHVVDAVTSHVASPPVFSVRAGPGTPIPERAVDVVWRAGLDLNPIDVGDEDQISWLEALVWPGEEYRLPRLRAAVEVARTDPPRVVRGDLRVDLPALVAEAPQEATLVIFHTAVLAYVRDVEDRIAFARTTGNLDAVWISNEAPEVGPKVADDVMREGPRSAFLLCIDGSPTAWTDPHGCWIEWRATQPAATYLSR